MKNKFLIPFAFLMFCSILSFTQTVGGDRDKQGCIPSAGYTFSILKNDCVRLFEEKIKLNEVNPKKSHTTFAAVIFSKDNKKAEIFLPDLKESQILLKTNTKSQSNWKKGNLVLSKKNGYILKRNGLLIYKSK